MKKNLKQYIILTLSFYAVWILAVPFTVNSLVPIVCKNISYNSNYSVDVQAPQMRLSVLPVAKFSAENIKVVQKKSNESIIFTNPHAAIRLLPLLSGRIHLNSIGADNVNINLQIKDNLELDENFFEKLSNIKFKCEKMEVVNFELSAWSKNVNKPIEYTVKDFIFIKNNRFLKLFLNSNLKIGAENSVANIDLFLPKNNDVSSSVFDVQISNFNLEPLGAYLKHYLPKDLKSINGIINVNGDKEAVLAEFSNCSIIMRDSAKSVVFPKKLNVTSKYSLNNKTINFEQIHISSPGIDATINGKIKNYLDKQKTFIDFNIQLNKSKVEDFISMLPPIVVEEFNVYKLKYYKFFGDAIGNFSVKGDIVEPQIFGDIYIENGVLVSPIKDTKGATVKLDFTGKSVNYDVHVPAGGAEHVWVKGDVELYNVKYANMRVWSTSKVDLALAESKVIPVHEILNFVIGPVPIMDVKGDGNIDIIVKGNRVNPHVWGTLNFDHVVTYFNEIPDLILTDAKAKLVFDDENARFTTSQGLVNGKNITIDGTCNLFGKFDFDVAIKNQQIDYLYKAIKTSTMIEEIKKMIPNLEVCDGAMDMTLKVYGAVKYIEDLKFNQNFFTKGNIKLLGNNFGMQGIKVRDTKGIIDFTSSSAIVDVTSKIGNSGLSAKANVKNNFVDAQINIPKLNLNDITPSLTDIQKDVCNIFVEVDSSYKGKLEPIELDKINFTAKILGIAPYNKINLSNGIITLKNDRLSIKNIKGNVADSQGSFDINMDVDKISSKPLANGSLYLKNFDLKAINFLSKYSVLPNDVRNSLNKIRFDNGKINLNAKINHNKVNAYTDLGGISLEYIPAEMPIKIVNGSLIVRNNTLRLNKINLLADDMPFIFDGDIKHLLTKQEFNVYVNSKPKQEFIDKYINKNQIYPVKIKGDIVYWAKIRGSKDNFDVKSQVNMAKNSSIYHLGATIGDVENAIVLNLDTKVLNQNALRIKEFSYDKLIASQNGRQTRLNMLKARGGIDVYADDLAFHDLKIKTQNPTDARIFNIIFRKPNIKQGQFTSDILFNGRLSNPRLLGDFHIFETNIPFLDTTMKNIALVFKDRIIEFSSKGEILGNDINFSGIMRNKLTPPYYMEKAALYTGELDLNYIVNKLKLSQVDNAHTFESFEGIDLGTIVIKNIKLNADSILLRNIVATDFEAKASFNEKKTLNVDDFMFNIANGNLRGNFSYNMKNNNTKLDLKARSIDANDLSIALFDLKNQIYGDLTGDINLSCNGSNFENCMKTLNGGTTFNVADGKMPKLGSLEYLLKAGNLLKGGLTSVSINSVIDIITPLKTGEFSNIYGKIDIKNGIAKNVEIATKGKDLSLFIGGTYNFATANAEMEVIGLLSKKISTMFGPLGNVSINTLFSVIPGVDLSKDTKILDSINRIPGIELSNKAYRKFIAEIKGNINGENYVTSFRWIN